MGLGGFLKKVFKCDSWRCIGRKTLQGLRFMGQKGGDLAIALAPVGAAVNPTVGAALPVAGGIAKGIGAAAGVGADLLSDKSPDVKGAAKDIKGAYDAYNQLRQRSKLERG